jgi:hypothetical protein
MFKER